MQADVAVCGQGARDHVVRMDHRGDLVAGIRHRPCEGDEMTLGPSRSAIRADEQQASHAVAACDALTHGKAFSIARRRRKEGSLSTGEKVLRSVRTCWSKASLWVCHTAAVQRSSGGFR